MAYMTMKSGTDAVVFENSVGNRGVELREEYQNADPFPHIVIDGFLPEQPLKRIIETFPERKEQEVQYDRPQERFKSGFNPDELDDVYLKTLFYSFNARPFLRFLEGLTGYTGLLPDPGFTGGGFHETLSGGHLGVHADFNLLKEYRLKRRINVLVYLNEDWKDDYGGRLELWKTDMSECVKKIEPLVNRCVIFNTEDDSFHGQPDPLTTPAGISRRSIALYYYVASDAIYNEFTDHTTLFKARKGTSDKVDYEVKTRHFINQHIPKPMSNVAKKLRQMVNTR
jgi:hypothetical protein